MLRNIESFFLSDPFKKFFPPTSFNFHKEESDRSCKP